jgi:hypothetical protein
MIDRRFSMSMNSTEDCSAQQRDERKMMRLGFLGIGAMYEVKRTMSVIDLGHIPYCALFSTGGSEAARNRVDDEARRQYSEYSHRSRSGPEDR